MKNLITLFILLPLCINAQITVSGIVFDKLSNQPLAFVTVRSEKNNTSVTAADGSFTIAIDSADRYLIFSMVGYLTVKYSIDKNNTSNITIHLPENASLLGTLVVSASRYEQKIEETTISMHSIKQEQITGRNPFNMESIIESAPGLNIMDGQVQIRGGAGFSYGAGSRVLLLMDDVPLLSGDANDIKWSFINPDNIERVEIIKGASSALYGSSALNGILNIKTGFPNEIPQSNLNFSSGTYFQPARKELVWWDRNPIFSRVSASHSRRIKNLDLVINAYAVSDEGYRELEQQQRLGISNKLRYRSEKVRGLSYGVNTSYLVDDGGLFILWEHADSALIPQNRAIQNYTNYRITVDPYIALSSDSGFRHSLKSRYYKTINKNDKNQSSIATTYFSEYQLQKKIKKLINTSGLSYLNGAVVSDSLYGHHVSHNLALHSQFDFKWEKFSFAMGGRIEYYRLDTAETTYTLSNTTIPVYPVFRSGINYQLFKPTYWRASFGKGYRFPSVAEKYIETNVNGLKIFPNPGLQPETGWSAETGIRQLFQFGNTKGMIDIAGFITEYKNMIEFIFDYYIPDTVASPNLTDYINYFGAKSQNIGNARISGAETEFALSAIYKKWTVEFSGGYTYMNPLNLNKNSTYIKTGTDTVSGILKYRYEHLAKADVNIIYKKIKTGFNIRYNSFMKNIDRSFQNEFLNDLIPGFHTGIYILPGLKEYREIHNKGDWVVDYRFIYNFYKKMNLQLVCNNLFNREYSSRPGDLQAPRNIVIAYTAQF